MNINKTLCVVLLVPFALLSLYALQQVGYTGIIRYHLPSPAGWQVFADLVVALTLLVTLMIRDAKRTGRTVWPYLLATVLLGSFGPLAYLLLGSRPAAAHDGNFAVSHRD